MNDDNFESFASIWKNKKTVKPPAYQWQELALQIIKELNIPVSKKSSVFKLLFCHTISLVPLLY